jgi:glutamate-1-semialdehyde 2,1-aminomutase
MKTIDRSRLASLMAREQKKFVDERPKSKALFERARKSLLAGVPMNWMVKWAGAFPPFVREAQGAHFFDVDGHRYIDFCLGDTGAMTGHSPSATGKSLDGRRFWFSTGAITARWMRRSSLLKPMGWPVPDAETLGRR